MWSFSEKYPNIAEYDAQNSKWSIGQGVYKGSPIIVRKNTSAKLWLGHIELSLKLSFAVPLNEPKPGRMPTANENMALEKIEDVIDVEVSKYFSGIFMMVITMGTFKEFVFYVKPGPDIGALHLGLKSMVGNYEVQCSGVIDKNWKAYKSF